jgi:5-formyltetrahydrofolate cyclo-ligase
MPEKSSLRKALLEKRRNIPRLLRHVKSRHILRTLSREPVFRRAEHVALYYGIAPEVETRTFLKKVLKDKKIYLPKIGPKRSMALYRIRSFSRDLKKGAYNIKEPRAFCKKRPVRQMDIIIVPGVAFDKSGGRLGRGGGYYDRLLRNARKTVKIGLCFREQIVKKVPMKAHDVKVDRVITD